MNSARSLGGTAAGGRQVGREAAGQQEQQQAGPTGGGATVDPECGSSAGKKMRRHQPATPTPPCSSHPITVPIPIPAPTPMPHTHLFALARLGFWKVSAVALCAGVHIAVTEDAVAAVAARPAAAVWHEAHALLALRAGAVEVLAGLRGRGGGREWWMREVYVLLCVCVGGVRGARQPKARRGQLVRVPPGGSLRGMLRGLRLSASPSQAAPPPPPPNRGPTSTSPSPSQQGLHLLLHPPCSPLRGTRCSARPRWQSIHTHCRPRCCPSSRCKSWGHRRCSWRTQSRQCSGRGRTAAGMVERGSRAGRGELECGRLHGWRQSTAVAGAQAGCGSRGGGRAADVCRTEPSAPAAAAAAAAVMPPAAPAHHDACAV